MSSQNANAVAISGGTITGMPAPTAPSDVATKNYVDSGGAAAGAATIAEFLANSAPTKLIPVGTVWGAAAAPKVLTDGATITPDFSLGIDFILTLTAAGRTLANPTNIKVGQKGLIVINQGGAGSNTITAWGGYWKFPGGSKPVLSTAVGAYDIISYAVVTNTMIVCTYQQSVA
jgi:hypothetical protein